MSELPRLRAEIDRLDDELLGLLNARAAVSKKIGETKRAQDPDAPVYRAEREAAVLRRLEAANPGPLPNEAISRIFHEVMSSSSALQRAIRAAYLGPAGTFSEAAVVRQFGRSAIAVPCANFEEAFRRTETGETDFSVVPVENSTEGTISRVLDLLLNSPLKVCAEVVVRVQQNQMRAKEGREGITKVYSHAQSLAQTQNWLNRHLPGVEPPGCLAAPAEHLQAQAACELPADHADRGADLGPRQGLFVGPALQAGFAIDQHHCEPYLVAATLRGAVDHVAHAEFARHAARIGGPALEAARGIGRNDPRARGLAELPRQVVRQNLPQPRIGRVGRKRQHDQ